MRFGRFSGSGASGDGEATRVVLKLESDLSERTRADLRRLAAEGGELSRGSEAAEPLERVLSGHRLRKSEPLFSDRQGRTTFREGVEMSMHSHEDELGGLNILHFNTSERARSAVDELRRDRRVEYAHLIPPVSSSGERGRSNSLTR